jgi:hypothetical protein
MPAPIVPGEFYGCHNRAPLITFGAKDCQYQLSALGRVDKRCGYCAERTKSEPFGKYSRMSPTLSPALTAK